MRSKIETIEKNMTVKDLIEQLSALTDEAKEFQVLVYEHGNEVSIEIDKISVEYKGLVLIELRI